MSALLGGVLQPLFEPEHLLALTGLGPLIGRQGDWRVPCLIFAAALAAGLAAIALAVGPTRASDILLACAAVAGVLVAIAAPIPKSIVWPLAAAGGAAFGLDSPPEVLSIRLAVVILIATGCAATVALAAIAACAAHLRRPWQAIGARVLGSWTAASAILVLAMRLAK